MKDFYWDIRPKPEYGTVEIRVLDTPLTVEHAAQLAAYAQTLAHYLITRRPVVASEDVYLVYKFNRFQACRYGLAGTFIDTQLQQQRPLQSDVLSTLDLLHPHARLLGNEAALAALRGEVETSRGDAAWLRETYRRLGSLNDVARRQSEQWMGPPPN
jgi:carboxylate-amine ligase